MGEEEEKEKVVVWVLLDVTKRRLRTVVMALVQPIAVRWGFMNRVLICPSQPMK